MKATPSCCIRGWGTCFSFLGCCLVLRHLSRSGVSLDFQNLSVRLFELLTKTSKLAKLVSKFSVRKRRFKSPGLCVCSMTATNFYSSLKAEYTPGAQLHRRSGEWLLVFICFILHDQSVFKKCVARKAHRKRATSCVLYSRSKNEVHMALWSKAYFWVPHSCNNCLVTRIWQRMKSHNFTLHITQVY